MGITDSRYAWSMGRPKKGAEKGSPKTTTQTGPSIDIQKALAIVASASNGSFSRYIDMEG